MNEKEYITHLESVISTAIYQKKDIVIGVNEQTKKRSDDTFYKVKCLNISKDDLKKLIEHESSFLDISRNELIGHLFTIIDNDYKGGLYVLIPGRLTGTKLSDPQVRSIYGDGDDVSHKKQTKCKLVKQEQKQQDQQPDWSPPTDSYKDTKKKLYSYMKMVADENPKTFTLRELAIYLVIYQKVHIANKWTWRIKLDDLIPQLHCSRNTALRGLKNLHDLKLIEIVSSGPGQGKKNSYRVLLDPERFNI
jgi:hypothetical protein